jgi:hypothetical protein
LVLGVNFKFRRGLGRRLALEEFVFVEGFSMSGFFLTRELSGGVLDQLLQVVFVSLEFFFEFIKILRHMPFDYLPWLDIFSCRFRRLLLLRFFSFILFLLFLLETSMCLLP